MSERKILVYIDQFKGAILPASLEIISAAFTLAAKWNGDVIALAVGEESESVAGRIYQYGPSEVFFAADDTLTDYRPEPFASVVTKVAQEQEVKAIVFPTTTRGRELAAMCSIDLNTGVMPDVSALEVVDDKIVVTRPVYAGKLLSKAICSAEPVILTIRNRAFKKPQGDSSKSTTPVHVEAVVEEAQILSKVTGYSESEGAVSLIDANVIVSGGRGVSNNPALEPPADLDEKEAEIWKAHQGFKLVGDLASVLGGAVGASRAAVDGGYIPYEHQVGQTGKVVTPDLYIANGISGAIQHLAGMRTSKVIVAINKDPDAPIFKLARFGVVGDLFDILPPLTEAFRKKLDK
jgi:electron transfer flavoprotein alpha subunit